MDRRRAHRRGHVNGRRPPAPTRTCVALSWARVQELAGCPGCGLASPVDRVQKLGLCCALPADDSCGKEQVSVGPYSPCVCRWSRTFKTREPSLVTPAEAKASQSRLPHTDLDGGGTQSLFRT